ncbi:MAG: ribonuclease D [Proteobacteria bacterium]|nr:ribonuclease D [Pseudomonadota bacterium]
MTAVANPRISRHAGDLAPEVKFLGAVAIDTETTGLHLFRDRLCLVQLSAGDGEAHLVQIRPGQPAPNLKAVLGDRALTKIFHFARFDLAVLRRDLGAECGPVYCTRTASKLVLTYTDRHGLKDLCRELLGVDLSKEQQSSDWAQAELTDSQLHYAASDVLYLHRLRERLDPMLVRENRMALAQACFDFLPARAALDLAGFENDDIFAH